MLYSLPDEIVGYVLEFLPQIDLLSTLHVDKKLNKLTNNRLAFINNHKSILRNGDVVTIIRNYTVKVYYDSREDKYEMLHYHYIIRKLCQYGYIKEVKLIFKIVSMEPWYKFCLVNQGLAGACRSGNVEIIKWMLQMGATVNHDIIQYACKGGYINIIKWMKRVNKKQLKTDKSEIMYTTTMRRTGLYTNACRSGNMRVVKYIIKICKYNFDGCGLEYACKSGNMSLVKFIIFNHGNDWNKGLHGACKYGFIDIVKLMITFGATDLAGGLFNAARGGHMNIVKFLITYNENIIRDSYREGIRGACRGFIQSQFEIKNRIEIIKFLDAKYADKRSYDGYLYIASMSGCIEIINLMISLGDMSLYNILGNACESGQIVVINLLLKNGCTGSSCWNCRGKYHHIDASTRIMS